MGGSRTAWAGRGCGGSVSRVPKTLMMSRLSVKVLADAKCLCLVDVLWLHAAARHSASVVIAILPAYLCSVWTLCLLSNGWLTIPNINSILGTYLQYCYTY